VLDNTTHYDVVRGNRIIYTADDKVLLQWKRNPYGLEVLRDLIELPASHLPDTRM
jgi:hypothetical protein